MTGTFDDWAGDRTPLARDGDGSSGTWSVDVAGVEPGAEYRFTIRTADGDLSRIDPYARHVTSSIGNGDRVRPGGLRLGRRRLCHADLGRPGDLRDARRLVRADRRPAGTFDDARHAAALPAAAGRLGGPGHAAVRVRGRHLVGLQPVPPVRHRVGATAGPTRSSASCARRTRTASRSSSTSSSTTSARPTSTCGGSTAGPRATGGGIYFYNDERAVTPWGATRPDYGRGEVRTFLRDSAMTWLEEFRCDGLRFDATVHIRTVEGYPARPGSVALPDGWSFLAWINDEIRARQPWKITIAEDIEDDPIARHRRPPTAGPGSGRNGTPGSSAASGRRSRSPTTPPATWSRSPPRSSARVAATPLTRVIYTESHDDVANGARPRPRGDHAGRRRQLVGEEARGPRLGARAHLARHPDAVPGPGAARGPLVRRRRTRSTGRRPARTAASSACTATSIALRRARTARRAGCAVRTSRSCAPTRRPRCWPCTAGWMADRTTTPWSSPTSPTGRSTTSPSGSLRRAAGTSASTRTRRATPPSSAVTRRSISMRTVRRSTVPAERARLARAVQRRDPVPGGRCAGVRSSRIRTGLGRWSRNARSAPLGCAGSRPFFSSSASSRSCWSRTRPSSSRKWTVCAARRAQHRPARGPCTVQLDAGDRGRRDVRRRPGQGRDVALPRPGARNRRAFGVVPDRLARRRPGDAGRAGCGWPGGACA